MCTVTIFHKNNNDFVLTSNRDEAPNREAIAPEFYTLGVTKVLLPKDKQSGGSWIGASQNNRVVCLLNGGFKIHERKAEYRQSRGIVVRDLLALKNINEVEAYNYKDIEPFTIIIADWNTSINFYEIVWDGEDAHFYQLGLANRIWSSSTLYSEEKKQARVNWFETFKAEHEFNAESILNFHKMAGNGNEDFGIVMDRGFVKTTSITQIEKTGDDLTMRFENLNTNKITTKTFKFSVVTND